MISDTAKLLEGLHCCYPVLPGHDASQRMHADAFPLEGPSVTNRTPSLTPVQNPRCSVHCTLYFDVKSSTALKLHGLSSFALLTSTVRSSLCNPSGTQGSLGRQLCQGNQIAGPASMHNPDLGKQLLYLLQLSLSLLRRCKGTRTGDVRPLLTLLALVSERLQANLLLQCITHLGAVRQPTVCGRLLLA